MLHSSSRGQSSYSHPFTGDLPPPHLTLGSNIRNTNSNLIHGISFDMWASAPNEVNSIDNELHVYTRLQGEPNQPAAPPMPLENIPDWRSAFPHLVPLVDDVSRPLDCDIILLEVNLELMADFPPSRSKLGIQLALDFIDSPWGGLATPTQLADWSCSTYIYEGGQKAKDAHHNLPQPVASTVKPFFESSWWAELFTQLTQEKRIAENSGHAETIRAADDHIRRFFRSLSALQELRASGPSRKRRHASSKYASSSISESKRMGILLWKFRQTRPGEVGTTTWRRLIPPNQARTTANNHPHDTTGMNIPMPTINSILTSEPLGSYSAAPQHITTTAYEGQSEHHPQWPIYRDEHGDLTNLFDTQTSFDFLNTISKGEEIRHPMGTDLYPYSCLPPENISQPAPAAVSFTNDGRPIPNDDANNVNNNVHDHLSLQPHALADTGYGVQHHPHHQHPHHHIIHPQNVATPPPLPPPPPPPPPAAAAAPPPFVQSQHIVDRQNGSGGDLVNVFGPSGPALEDLGQGNNSNHNNGSNNNTSHENNTITSHHHPSWHGSHSGANASHRPPLHINHPHGHSHNHSQGHGHGDDAVRNSSFNNPLHFQPLPHPHHSLHHHPHHPHRQYQQHQHHRSHHSHLPPAVVAVSQGDVDSKDPPGPGLSGLMMPPAPDELLIADKLAQNRGRGGSGGGGGGLSSGGQGQQQDEDGGHVAGIFPDDSAVDLVQ